jgi:hypothetical protein
VTPLKFRYPETNTPEVVYSTIVAGNGSQSMSSGLLMAAVAVVPDHICVWMEDRLCIVQCLLIVLA